MNLRFVAYLVAVVSAALGLGMLASALCSGIYADAGLVPLLVSTGICLAVAIPLYVWSRKAGSAYIGFREAFAGVAASWVAAAVLSALPYTLAGVFGPLDALFESISGLTTTGASVLVDYAQPRGIMFWRGLSQWYGGMGIVVLFLALLPAVGGGGIRLFAAEAPGPSPERLTPRIRDTAKRLWLIYAGISLAEVVLLIAVGLDPYSALTHTFATMATGGFSPEAQSVGAYQSLAVELVVVLFMFLAGLNFALYSLLLSRRARQVVQDPELRLYVGILALSTVAVAVSLVVTGSHQTLGHAFREALFQVVSIQTTTGFVTADFDTWNNFSRTLFLLLMFVGGCAGSTAGGIKVVRLLVLGKNARRTLAQAVHPHAVIPVRVGRRVISNEVVTGVLSFFFLYVLLFALGTLVVAATGESLVTSASAVAATLNNVGPGMELVGATMNYAPLAPLAKITLMVLMLLGRLEILAFAVPFTPAFWRR
ncbi:MAG: TrkH family potassium uptake protein [Thermoleophilia bacterium]|nr:TrkH family potassium uptake protein [Thermoleophilia bacterium]